MVACLEEIALSHGLHLADDQLTVLARSMKSSYLRPVSDSPSRAGALGLQLFRTDLPGVVVLEPRLYRDERGFFAETYRADALSGPSDSGSSCRTTIPGRSRRAARHAPCRSAAPRASWCASSRARSFDVAADVRRGSPTFGKWVGVPLSADNFRQCYIPPGFAHGFCVVSPYAQVEYKCTDFYDPGARSASPGTTPRWRLRGRWRRRRCRRAIEKNASVIESLDRLPVWTTEL